MKIRIIPGTVDKTSFHCFFVLETQQQFKLHNWKVSNGSNLTYHKTSLVQFDLNKFGQIYNQKAKVKVELYQTTFVSQADFECSKYSRSIYVIDVKSNQNFSCGLRNISDNTFDFCGIRENSNSFV